MCRAQSPPARAWKGLGSAWAEALAVQLEGESVPEPRALTREDAEQHATGELGEGLAPGDVVMFVEPAPVNPVSLEVAEAIRASGLTQKEVARRMGTTQSAVSRLADPFYWGHSVESLRRLSEALGATLELRVSLRATVALGKSRVAPRDTIGV